VLTLDPRSTAPLDDLYAEILSALPQEPEQLRILHTIWQGKYGPLDIDPEEIDMFLQFRLGTCRLLLRGLHSLFQVPPVRRGGVLRIICPLHSSIVDYLGDARRSGQRCVSQPWLSSDYLQCIIRLLSSPPPANATWWIVG
jgi:hypothetical protein